MVWITISGYFGLMQYTSWCCNIFGRYVQELLASMDQLLLVTSVGHFEACWDYRVHWQPTKPHESILASWGDLTCMAELCWLLCSKPPNEWRGWWYKCNCRCRDLTCLYLVLGLEEHADSPCNCMMKLCFQCSKDKLIVAFCTMGNARVCSSVIDFTSLEIKV